MTERKLASFYADPIKQACDAYCLRKAFELRSCSIDSSLRWAAMRAAKFVYQFAKGLTRPSAAPPSSNDTDVDGTVAPSPTFARSSPAHE
jgi:hypothetical protein